MSSIFRFFVGCCAAILLVFALGGSAAPAPSRTPAAVVTAEQRHALRAFERFLDHHPLLEDELRLNPQLRFDRRYLDENRELRDFLAATPQLEPALRHYPRYFLFRALLREARGPLKQTDLALLVDLLEHEPSIAAELARRPQVIRDSAFLAAHPTLHDLLKKNPPLARAFLPPP